MIIPARTLIAGALITLVTGVGYYSQSLAQVTSPSATAAMNAPASGTTVTVSSTSPDYVEAGVREKVNKTRSDMRVMATGLEAYYIDNNRYPEFSSEGKIRKPASGEHNIVSFAGPSLTTPISFLTAYYEDPFATGEGQTFAYYSPEPGWILFSPGPDGKFDLDWELYDPKVEQPSKDLLRNAYDPTNGALSGGDLFRVKQ